MDPSNPGDSDDTSFINLAVTALHARGVQVLELGPSMSSAERVVESFFSELSSQLKLKPELSQIGDALEQYGASFPSVALSPVVGPWLERLVDLTGRQLGRPKTRTTGSRRKLVRALKTLPQPIVVVVFDNEPLTTSDTAPELLRLIRLTDRLPNLDYLIAL